MFSSRILCCRGIPVRRNHLFLACFSLMACLIAVPAGGESPPNARIPLEAFARLPLVDSVQLSPNGEHMAMLMNEEGTTRIWTQKLRSKAEPNLVTETDNSAHKFMWFIWANHERLLVSITFAGSRNGIPVQETRLLAINRDGSDEMRLVRDKKVPFNEPRGWEPQFRDNVIDRLPDDDDHILISVDLDKPGAPGVHKYNIYTGRRKRVQRSYPPITDWTTDSQGKVRVGVGYKETDFKIIVRGPDKRRWRSAWHYRLFEEPAIRPMGFGVDPNILYVRYPHEGKDAVFTVDISEKALERKLVFADPDYDVGGSLIISPRTYEAVGVHYISSAGLSHFWDESYRALQEATDEALPDTINYIASISRDETRYVVFATSAVEPGTYYLGDRKERRLDKIFESYPGLNHENLAAKKEVSYTSRDGLEIEGYLTLPRGRHSGPLPAIIYPHGGPLTRDHLKFDYWTQFLASRGYAVLQMNYRGSYGYGESHLQAGLRNWGLQMQDDITDGAKWLVEQEIADPGRMCIVGSSYGGYAALMGAVKTPDLYQCAVSFAGISNLRLLLRSQFWFMGRAIVEEQIGDTWKDRARLKETSPVEQVDKIRIPILIAHGDKDRIVDIEHAKQMVKELKRKNKVHEYLLLEDGDHHLSLQRNRTLFLETLESFLARYLRN